MISDAMFEDIINNIGILIFMIIFFTFLFTVAILDEKFRIFRKFKRDSKWMPSRTDFGYSIITKYFKKIKEE